MGSVGREQSLVIAERILDHEREDGRTSEVRVVVFRPAYIQSLGVWTCEFQILGLDDDQIRDAHDVDSLGALVSALAIVRELLEYHRRAGARLTWLGDAELDILGKD